VQLIVGPGTVLKCIHGGTCACGCSKVTQGSIYTLECIEEDHPFFHALYCELDACSCLIFFLRDKDHGFCAERFVPLNDGDTSLVKDEEVVEEITVDEFAKRFINV
jgi:hypothetical protein